MPLRIDRLAGLAALALAGACSTLQTLEPVLAPPSQFQLDRTTRVEFVAANRIGARCAERGVAHAGACGSRELITLPDPCGVRGDAYAAGLCGANGARPVTIVFAHPDLAAGRCAPGERGRVMVCRTAERVVAVNPCLYPDRGWYADLACHELAHANGWTGDHAGGSLVRQPSFVKARLKPGDVLSPEAVRIALLAKAGEQTQR